jgi:hypothetical protein
VKVGAQISQSQKAKRVCFKKKKKAGGLIKTLEELSSRYKNNHATGQPPRKAKIHSQLDQSNLYMSSPSVRRKPSPFKARGRCYTGPL